MGWLGGRPCPPPRPRCWPAPRPHCCSPRPRTPRRPEPAPLEKACGADKGAGATACEACALRQWSVLRKAGCSEADELAWCQPPPPAPAPDLSGRAFLTHATQKIMPDTQFTPCATPRCLKRGVFGVAAAQNEYEPFLVVLNGPLTNVSIHDLRLPPAVSAIEHRVYRVESAPPLPHLPSPPAIATSNAVCALLRPGCRRRYVNVVNVSDCDSPGPGRYPDALIPAVDEYKRTVGALFAVYWLCRLALPSVPRRCGRPPQRR